LLYRKAARIFLCELCVTILDADISAGPWDASKLSRTLREKGGKSKEGKPTAGS